MLIIFHDFEKFFFLIFRDNFMLFWVMFSTAVITLQLSSYFFFKTFCQNQKMAYSFVHFYDVNAENAIIRYPLSRSRKQLIC